MQTGIRQGAEASDPAEWVGAYGDDLYRYAVSRLRDADAAEEVVQETFLSGIRHREDFRGEGSRRGWLMQILKRKIVDHVRARARLVSAEGADRPDDEDGPDIESRLFDGSGFWREAAADWGRRPSRRLEDAEFWQLVERCLARLARGQADAFVLSVLEELPSESICETLGITASNLWVRLHRARLGLARCLERNQETE